jgi:hypothetical protein
VTTERGAALRETIRSWLVAGQIRIIIGGGPRGLNRAGAAAPAVGARTSTGNSMAAVTPAMAGGDELRFTTPAVTPSPVPNVAMRLYIDADVNTPEKGLTLEYQPNLQQGLVRQMLDSLVDTLKVEYLDARTQRWFPSTEAATLVGVRAVRVWMIQNPAAPPSPLLGVPMMFSQGFTTTNTNR